MPTISGLLLSATGQPHGFAPVRFELAAPTLGPGGLLGTDCMAPGHTIIHARRDGTFSVELPAGVTYLVTLPGSRVPLYFTVPSDECDLLDHLYPYADSVEWCQLDDDDEETALTPVSGVVSFEQGTSVRLALRVVFSDGRTLRLSADGEVLLGGSGLTPEEDFTYVIPTADLGDSALEVSATWEIADDTSAIVWRVQVPSVTSPADLVVRVV